MSERTAQGRFTQGNTAARARRGTFDRRAVLIPEGESGTIGARDGDGVVYVWHQCTGNPDHINGVWFTRGAHAYGRDSMSFKRPGDDDGVRFPVRVGEDASRAVRTLPLGDAYDGVRDERTLRVYAASDSFAVRERERVAHDRIRAEHRAHAFGARSCDDASFHTHGDAPPPQRREKTEPPPHGWDTPQRMRLSGYTRDALASLARMTDATQRARNATRRDAWAAAFDARCAARDAA